MSSADTGTPLIRREGPAALRQAALLLAVSLLAAAVLWAMRGERLPLIADAAEVDLLERPVAGLRAREDSEAIVVDRHGRVVARASGEALG